VKDLTTLVPEDWHHALRAEFESPSFDVLNTFLKKERSRGEVFPPEKDVFNALKLTPFNDVRVLILGQDPYHDVGQAHGLAFSVMPGVRPPPSLVNIYKELQSDLGIPPVKHGHLESWARNGVLLLNAVLTVRAHQANSHQGKGWERLTDAIIRRLSAREDPVVFVLWGAYAQKKKALIDANRHPILETPHPSPLSASKGFFGSKVFSRINAELVKGGKTPVDWRLPQE